MKLKSLSGLKFYSYHVGETRFGVVDSVISEKKKHTNDIEQDFKNFNSLIHNFLKATSKITTTWRVAYFIA